MIEYYLNVFILYPYLHTYITFYQHRVDIIDQVELRSPRHDTHLPAVCDLLLALALAPDRSDQRLLVSHPIDIGKVR